MLPTTARRCSAVCAQWKLHHRLALQIAHEPRASGLFQQARPTLFACRRGPGSLKRHAPSLRTARERRAAHAQRASRPQAVVHTRWEPPSEAMRPEVGPPDARRAALQVRPGRVRAGAEASSTASVRVLDRHGGVQAASPLMCDSSKSLRTPTISPTAPASLASLPSCTHPHSSPCLCFASSPPVGNRSRNRSVRHGSPSSLAKLATSSCLSCSTHRLAFLASSLPRQYLHHTTTPRYCPGPRHPSGALPRCSSYGSLKDGRLPCDAT
jgi:hypothetical protein